MPLDCLSVMPRSVAAIAGIDVLVCCFEQQSCLVGIEVFVCCAERQSRQGGILFHPRPTSWANPRAGRQCPAEWVGCGPLRAGYRGLESHCPQSHCWAGHWAAYWWDICPQNRHYRRPSRHRMSPRKPSARRWQWLGELDSKLGDHGSGAEALGFRASL